MCFCVCERMTPDLTTTPSITDCMQHKESDVAVAMAACMVVKHLANASADGKQIFTQ